MQGINAALKVLIVEDHQEAATVLIEAVRQVYPASRVICASSLSSAFEYVQEQAFEVALVDLGLPDGSGVNLIRYLSRVERTPQIIVTTIFDDERNLLEALKAGANGYLLKGHSRQELAQFLLHATQGRPPLSPSIAHTVLTYFHQLDTAQLPQQYGQSVLTDREEETLVLIAKGYSVKEVGELLEITTNTVSSHVKSIYRKLNLHNRAEATAAAVALNLYQP